MDDKTVSPASMLAVFCISAGAPWLSSFPRRRLSVRLLSQSFSHENLTLEENSCRMISMPGHDRRRALKGTDDLASFPSCLPKLLKPRQ